MDAIGWVRRCGLAMLLALCGCGSLLTEGTADVAGVAGAAVADSFTRNGAVAAGIGLGVQSLARTGLNYVERRVHKAEQDAIAQAAGPLSPGAIGVWSIRHSVPIEDDAQGQVVVSRDFGASIFRCKEIVFSVDTQDRQGSRRAFYTATICQDGQAWRWASAEPSTSRWGGLQ